MELSKLTPKELILKAVEDVLVCKARGLEIDTGVWAKVNGENKICSVCFAGAVIYNTDGYEFGPGLSLPNLKLPEEDNNIFIALDYLRLGFIRDFCLILKIPLIKTGEHIELVEVKLPDPEEDFEGFINSLKYIAGLID